MIAKTNLNEEDNFLISLCRLEISDSLKVVLQEKFNKVKDWDYFCFMANWHGVAALAYNNIERLGFLDIVPKKNRDFLHGRMLMSVSRNVYIGKYLTKTLSILDKAGIKKTVLIKGMALELSVYGNRGLRQMSDSDVLMTKEDCILSRNILLSQGFRSLQVKSIFHKPIFIEIGKHLPSLIKEDFSLELHHELFSRGDGRSTSWLYENAKGIELYNQQAYIPSPLAGFLYLIRHLSLHEIKNESQLRLYCDLVVLLDKYHDEILDEELIVRAGQAGLAEELANRLMVLQEFWEMEYPERIQRYVVQYGKKEFMNRFQFFVKSPKDNKVANKAIFYRHQIGEINGLTNKILFVLGDLFPTFTFMKKRYNCGNKFIAIFYYPHRLGKLLYLLKQQHDKGDKQINYK
jgi:hypothetical protein